MPPEPWPKASFLGSLQEQTRDGLLGRGRVRAFAARENLIRQGDPGGVLFLLLSGRVNVLAVVENGVESLLAVRHPGDLLGEIAVLSGSPRTATVTARVPSTALVVSGDEFKRFIGVHPEVGLALAAVAADRVRQANLYRADAAGYEVDQRLARSLLYQAQRHAKKIDGYWTVDLLQAELAMLIGAKEGTVQKALAGLKDLVVSRRGRVVIYDVGRLARLADMELCDELRED